MINRQELYMYVIQIRSSEQIERLECERKGLLKTTNGISQNEYYDISLHTATATTYFPI